MRAPLEPDDGGLPGVRWKGQVHTTQTQISDGGGGRWSGREMVAMAGSVACLERSRNGMRKKKRKKRERRGTS